MDGNEEQLTERWRPGTVWVGVKLGLDGRSDEMLSNAGVSR